MTKKPVQKCSVEMEYRYAVQKQSVEMEYRNTVQKWSVYFLSTGFFSYCNSKKINNDGVEVCITFSFCFLLLVLVSYCNSIKTKQREKPSIVARQSQSISQMMAHLSNNGSFIEFPQSIMQTLSINYFLSAQILNIALVERK